MLLVPWPRAWIFRRASNPLSMLRTPRMTCSASREANVAAASNPMPVFAPVTRTVLPEKLAVGFATPTHLS